MRGGERRKREQPGDAPLTGRLEEEPLQLVDLLLETLDGDLALRIVLVNEVKKNGRRFPTHRKSEPPQTRRGNILPNGVVIVLVVDERGRAAVGVQLQIRWLLVLQRHYIQVFALVLKSEKVEQIGDFPAICEQRASVSDEGTNNRLLCA